MTIRSFTLVLISLILFSCQNTKQYIHDDFFEKIIGEWQLEDMPVVEKWTYVDGQFLASVIVTSGTDQLVTEEIQIIENDDGIFYEADVEDQNNGEPVLFKMIFSDENKIVFENKEHDFPQRITYEFLDDNKLIATIEGMLDGVSKSMDFNYSRDNNK
jgi:hypothetical protein